MKEGFWILLIMLTYLDNTRAQNLNQHQWKDRIILIGADNYDQAKLKEQLKRIQRTPEDLNERKLVVYEVTPQGFRYHHDGQVESVNDNGQLFLNMFGKGVKFQVALIGLDGGTKRRWNDLIDNEQIFGLIDTMPMRRAELRRKRP